MTFFHCFAMVDYGDDIYFPYSLEQTLYRQWRPVLEEIRKLPPDDEVARWTDEWITLGTHVGLSPDTISENEERAIRLHEDRIIPYDRCHWRGCLCSNHEPLHKMQECRGCRRARYCGRECQKKYANLTFLDASLLWRIDPYISDWKDGGHRNSCSRKYVKDESD